MIFQCIFPGKKTATSHGQARSRLTGQVMLEARLPQKCTLILAFAPERDISPTGFLIQCMTSRQRVLKVLRQRSSSFRSGQWQMSRRGRSKTACPGQTTELWSACRGELLLQRWEETSSWNIIFPLQYGTVLSRQPQITACYQTVGDPCTDGWSCRILSDFN